MELQALIKVDPHIHKNSDLPLSCPLCCQSNFPTIDSLKLSLIKVTSRPLSCPICSEVVLGLDKLTIHLFAHSVLTENQSSVEQPKKVEDLKLVRKPRCRKKETIKELPGKNNGAVYSPLSETEETSLPIQCNRVQEPCKSQSQNKETLVNSFVQENNSNQESYQLNKIANAEPRFDPVFEVVRSPQNNIQTAPIQFELQMLPPVAYKCDTCDLQFQEENLLTAHKKLVHEPAELQDDTNKFQCHICQKSFKMNGSLRIHLRVAHYGFQCRRNIGQQSDDHFVNFTPLLNLCPRPLNNEQNYGSEQHSQQQKIDGNVCDICGKNFTTKYFLKKHKRLHTGEMPYSCNICGKTFTFQQSYHKHLLYHSDEKPHVCSTCGRAFKELSTLHNHERIHSGEKPFRCETCGKCFRQRVSYLVHRRIHTGTNIFVFFIHSISFIFPRFPLQRADDHVGTNIKILR